MATQAPDSIQQDQLGESLPAPAPRDVVRLLVQSPRRLFLYWTFARDPHATLRRAFGRRAEGFELCARLVDLSDETIAQSVMADGATSLWLDAAPRRAYRAELGFAAADSPFIRVLTSAPIETPPDAASELTDDASDFHIGTRDFAALLAASGFAAHAHEPLSDETADRRDVVVDAKQAAYSSLSNFALSSFALPLRAGE